VEGPLIVAIPTIPVDQGIAVIIEVSLLCQLVRWTAKPASSQPLVGCGLAPIFSQCNKSPRAKHHGYGCIAQPLFGRLSPMQHLREYLEHIQWPAQ
jgi:hypothetical protein